MQEKAAHSHKVKCIIIPYFFNQTPTVDMIFFAGPFSAATIRRWLLFEGGYYSRTTTIQGRLLFKGGNYSRTATIQGWQLFEGGI